MQLLQERPRGNYESFSVFTTKEGVERTKLNLSEKTRLHILSPTGFFKPATLNSNVEATFQQSYHQPLLFADYIWL